MAVTYTERFGFLNMPTSIEFDSGRVFPVEHFREALEFIHEFTNTDGFYYPPMSQNVLTDIQTKDIIKKIPNTERPAAVFHLPVSHILHIDNPVSDRNSSKEDASLIIHLLGFFFGTRLQFEDWRFDGRVPIKPTNSFTYEKDVPSDFISKVYNQWRNWSPEFRKRYINILYMHSKADGCEWEWDAFIYRYIVFDAIYKLFHDLCKIKFGTHKARLFGLCNYFSIYHEPQHLEDIYQKRNHLFHEALWDSETPGHKIGEAYFLPKFFGKLNSRLIIAVAGYTNKYSKSNWFRLGWETFDKLEQVHT